MSEHDTPDRIICRYLMYRLGNRYIRLPYVVLGRNYLFKRFDITFYENRHKMSFQRTKNQLW